MMMRMMIKMVYVKGVNFPMHCSAFLDDSDCPAVFRILTFLSK